MEVICELAKNGKCELAKSEDEWEICEHAKEHKIIVWYRSDSIYVDEDGEGPDCTHPGRCSDENDNEVKCVPIFEKMDWQIDGLFEI